VVVSVSGSPRRLGPSSLSLFVTLTVLLTGAPELWSPWSPSLFVPEYVVSVLCAFSVIE